MLLLVKECETCARGMPPSIEGYRNANDMLDNEGEFRGQKPVATMTNLLKPVPLRLYHPPSGLDSVSGMEVISECFICVASKERQPIAALHVQVCVSSLHCHHLISSQTGSEFAQQDSTRLPGDCLDFAVHIP